MNNYTELDVWIKSRELVNLVYEITKIFPKEEQYSLTDQIRRSVVSIPSNIAEGCGRRTAKDTLQFLFIARGSLYELETQMFLAYDQKYLAQEKLHTVLACITESKKLVNGFINYYEKLKNAMN